MVFNHPDIVLGILPQRPSSELVAIASQNSFVFFLNGVSHIYRAICCKMGYRTDVPVKDQGPRGGGYRTIMGEREPSPEKVSHEKGYRSDSIAKKNAIWGH